MSVHSITDPNIRQAILDLQREIRSLNNRMSLLVKNGRVVDTTSITVVSTIEGMQVVAQAKKPVTDGTIGVWIDTSGANSVLKWFAPSSGDFETNQEAV